MPVNTRHKRWLLVAVGALCASVLVACAEDDEPSATDDPTSEAPTSESSGASPSEGGGGSDEVAAAQAKIEPFLKPPTVIGPSEPLSGPPPTDKTWVVITCELPQCKTISDGAIDAAEAAGVPTELLSYKTTDGTTLTSAVKQALDFDPFAVTPIGFSQTLYNDLQDEYADAGVFITPMALGDLETSEVITEGSATQFDYFKSGGFMADFVIVDSDAKAKVLVQDIPAFAVLKAYADGFREELEAGCAECTVESLDLAPAQLASNGLVPAIVSALQTNPDIEYLAVSNVGFLAGIGPALEAAGLEDIKIVGGSADINALQAVKDGVMLAVTAQAEDQYGWLALDLVFRKALGMEQEEGGGGRSEMIATQETAEPTDTGLDHPTDFEDQYLALWGLS